MEATMNLRNCRIHTLTKREANLMVHIEANFRDVPFTEDEVAASIGWPIEEVRAALETCAAFGLTEPPEPIVSKDDVVVGCGKPVGIDDLLTPEEQEEARRVAATSTVPEPADASRVAADECSSRSSDGGDGRVGELPGTPFSTEWRQPLGEGLAQVLTGLAARCGLQIANLPGLLAEFMAGLPENPQYPGEMRPVVASLKRIADSAASRPNGAAFSLEVRAFAVRMEKSLDALDAMFGELEAAGWAWKDTEGQHHYVPVVNGVMVVETMNRDPAKPPLDPASLLRRLHEALPEYCASMLRSEGCPEGLLRQMVERECHLIEEVLFGEERAHRPIAYPDMVPQMRRLVSAMDMLTGICVTSWGYCDHPGDARHAKLGNHYHAAARVLPDDRGVLDRLRDCVLEHCSDHVVHAATVVHRDGREVLHFGGVGDPDEAAQWISRSFAPGGDEASKREAAARRAAGWRTYRDSGWLTREEVMEVVGIDTDDEAVRDIIIAELELDRVSGSDHEPLFNPTTIEKSIGAGVGKRLLECLRERFAGRFRESMPEGAQHVRARIAGRRRRRSAGGGEGTP
jgi:hypothetical protein